MHEIPSRIARATGGVLLAAGLLGTTACSPEPSRVMSFNLLCSVCDVQNYDPWRDRLDAFADIFERQDPDLVGTQELLTFGHVDDLDALLPRHGVVQAALDEAGDPTLSYPDAMIFYRRARYEVVDSGSYWLSQNPDTGPYPAWDLSLPRAVVWAQLRDRMSGEDFVLFNTHFDNNTPNKVPSAELFMERAGLAAQLPLIAAGDFNSRPDSPSYEILVEGNDGPGGFGFTNSFDLAAAPRVDGNTGLGAEYGCGDKEPKEFPACRIDHIFVGGEGNFEVSDWVTDVWQYGPEPNFPSDHRAIQAEIEIR